MYIDSAAACNDLAFQLGNDAVGVGAAAMRSWSIKVLLNNQYEHHKCLSNLLGIFASFRSLNSIAIHVIWLLMAVRSTFLAATLAQ